ncbi:hypothetical protein [Streptomyces sp. NPDC059787]|uniref:hypothetical protein n=1 Tax=Streptomyces sp. NPDC059787 TaxID=3346947 RepID=UPI00365EEBDB
MEPRSAAVQQGLQGLYAVVVEQLPQDGGEAVSPGTGMPACWTGAVRAYWRDRLPPVVGGVASSTGGRLSPGP